MHVQGAIDALSMTVMNDISRPRLLALATILASLVVQAGAQSAVVPATCPANEEWVRFCVFPVG